MHFITSLSLLAAAGLASARSLTNGMWEGTNFGNGTMLVRPFGAPDTEAFTIETLVGDTTEARLAKRYTGCFGYALDHKGVDVSVQSLRDWANAPGGQTLRSGSRNNWKGFVYAETIAYYCIDAPNSSGNIDLNDVNYALSNMDSACPAYTASYFKWDGSVEIVGKDKAGANICV